MVAKRLKKILWERERGGGRGGKGVQRSNIQEVERAKGSLELSGVNYSTWMSDAFLCTKHVFHRGVRFEWIAL